MPVSSPSKKGSAQIEAFPESTTIVQSSKDESLTYGEACKLLARLLNKNPDGDSALVESIREIVSGTGLDASYDG